MAKTTLAKEHTRGAFHSCGIQKCFPEQVTAEWGPKI